jgi:hypothetical protein
MGLPPAAAAAACVLGVSTSLMPAAAALQVVHLDMNGHAMVVGGSVTRSMHAYMFARHRRRYVLKCAPPRLPAARGGCVMVPLLPTALAVSAAHLMLPTKPWQSFENPRHVLQPLCCATP